MQRLIPEFSCSSTKPNQLPSHEKLKCFSSPLKSYTKIVHYHLVKTSLHAAYQGENWVFSLHPPPPFLLTWHFLSFLEKLRNASLKLSHRKTMVFSSRFMLEYRVLNLMQEKRIPTNPASENFGKVPEEAASAIWRLYRLTISYNWIGSISTLEIRKGSGLNKEIWSKNRSKGEAKPVKLHLMRTTMYFIKSATLILRRVTQRSFRYLII